MEFRSVNQIELVSFENAFSVDFAGHKGLRRTIVSASKNLGILE